MANSPSIVLGSWISLMLVLSASSVLSQEILGPYLPAPTVSYNRPKSDMIQLVWDTSQMHGLLYQVEATKANEEHTSKVFVCENYNFNGGMCTISGLSAGTKYNITVRGCNKTRCTDTTYITIETLTKSNVFHFSAIFVIFIIFLFIFSAVMNYDLIAAVIQSGCKYLTPRSRRVGQTPQNQESTSESQDVALTLMTDVPNEESLDRSPGPSSSLVKSSPSQNSETGTGNLQAVDQPMVMVDLLAPTVDLEEQPQVPLQHSEPSDVIPTPSNQPTVTVDVPAPMVNTEEQPQLPSQHSEPNNETSTPSYQQPPPSDSKKISEELDFVSERL